MHVYTYMCIYTYAQCMLTYESKERQPAQATALCGNDCMPMIMTRALTGNSYVHSTTL